MITADNKIWFVTGISSGLGKALAQSIMNKGDVLLGTFRTPSEVNDFNQKHQGKGKAYLLDLGKVNDIEGVVNQVIAENERIDVLVNNAGTGFIGAVEEASMEEVRQVFEINLFGTLRLTQAILPHMRKQNKGHIIQISSHGGIKAFAGFGIYNASKFALEGFSEALAQEVAPLGINVSIVEPGPFRTNFAGTKLAEAQTEISDYAQTAGAFRTMLKSVDGKQEGDPVKAAQAIINLAYSEQPSLRMPLGKTALKTIGMKLESVRNDLESHQKIAEEAVY